MQDTNPTLSQVDDIIGRSIVELYPELISWRRDFHRYPESGWTEYRTSAKIAERLELWGWKVFLGDEVLNSSARMGVPSSEVLTSCETRASQEGVSDILLERMKGGRTGVVAEWKSGIEGPVFALRFDIDCNDLQETEQEGHIPVKEGFASRHEGCMHACGHDGHAAMGLAVAKWISHYHRDFPLMGTIRLIFQPAEEGCRGAQAIVEKGWLDDVDYFLSGHIGFRSFELGEVVLNTTGFYATTKWDTTFIGKPAHASGEPELGKNALLAASTAALNVHAISRHSQGVSRINVGKLVAGSGRNIVPSHAYMQIETRGETEAINQYISDELQRILRASATMYDVELKLEKVGEAGEAKGTPEWVERLYENFSQVSGITRLISQLSLGASEDVVFMMKRVQERGGSAAYLLFGSSLAAMHHQAEFHFDERVLQIGVEGYVRALVNTLGEK